MTKEELEKEAEEYSKKATAWLEDREPLSQRDIKIAYLVGAEPREKQIADLEHQLVHRNCVDCSNHSSKLKMKTLELERENTELKDKLDNWVKCAELRLANWQKYEKENKLLGERCNQLLKDKGNLTDELAKWKEEWQEQVQKANNEGWERTQQTLQLTKAKNHIKQLLDCLKQDTNDPQTNYYVCQYMDKAEQFLKEIEKMKDKELEEQVEDWKSDSKHNLELMKGLNNRISDLEKENAELKETIADIEKNFRICESNADTYYDQLTKAKEIIALGLRVCETSSIEYMNLYQKQAEQFLEKVK